MLNDLLQAKLYRMQDILRSLERVAVAFSAGADSTLVLKVALDTLGGDRVVAVTGRSDSLAAAEFQDACRLAGHVGTRHAVLDTDEFHNENYLSNPQNRCYFCKTTLYQHMARYAAEHGFKAMVNGSNADDLHDWRPGLKAAGEFNVRAPLAEAEITKAEVRELSRHFGLPTSDKPASPCLSSRVPYGQRITPEKLAMIEGGETFLKSLGIRECRVRHHGELARIEVPVDDLAALAEPAVRARIDARFRELGFTYVSLDLRGLRSGGLNEGITLNVACRSAAATT